MPATGQFCQMNLFTNKPAHLVCTHYLCKAICITLETIFYKERFMKAMATPFAILVATVLLTACGGGSDAGSNDSTTPTTPTTPAPVAKLEGAYEGGTDQLFVYSVTLENGDSWMLYGPATNKLIRFVGVVHATQGSSDGSTYSARTRDYFYDGQVFDGRLSGSYVPGKAFRGEIASNGRTAPFTTEAVVKTEYDYQAPAKLSSLAGTWNGGILGGGTGQIDISAAGAIQANLQGCSVTGQAQPRASGKNVFDVGLTFGPAPCRLPGQQTQGIALSFELAGGAKQLVVTGATADAAAGTALLAAR